MLNLMNLARNLGAKLNQKKLMMSCAESCTGGMLAASLTAIAGSSAWFDRAFITYSNSAKQQMLGVSAHTLSQFGAVSETTAREMVLGAIQNSDAQVAVSITGIAGPSGGTQSKPVGTVCFAWFFPDQSVDVQTCQFKGDRQSVRQQSTQHAMSVLLERI